MDFFCKRRGHILSDKIRFDRQFAVTTINQHSELDALGRPKSFSASMAARTVSTTEQDIIHQHDSLSGDVEWDFGRMNLGRGSLGKIIPMHVDVEPADLNGMSPN
jgi:hypothetical protein